jgi:hypothetical protein
MADFLFLFLFLTALGGCVATRVLGKRQIPRAEEPQLCPHAPRRRVCLSATHLGQ